MGEEWDSFAGHNVAAEQEVVDTDLKGVELHCNAGRQSVVAVGCTGYYPKLKHLPLSLTMMLHLRLKLVVLLGDWQEEDSHKLKLLVVARQALLALPILLRLYTYSHSTYPG